MKKALQFTFLMLFTLALNAQSSVTIQINHLLDGVEFQNGTNSTNDLGNDFMVDRLQYYLSGFSIIHDGGQVTEVNDLYSLVSLRDSSLPSNIELGEFEIENLEAVRFNFGVDEEANHSDPSAYPSTHPLAPQFPSMHWGWTAGYRFIALEGKSGPNVNQDLQFHCIGDNFYLPMEFPVTMSGESTYTVELDAEYKNLLQGIDISGGLVIHGGFGEMSTLATNFSENVFSLSTTTNTQDSELVNSFEVFPNPVTNGQLNIRMDVNSTNNILRVQDALGRVIYNETQSSNTQIELSNAGLYFLSIVGKSGEVLASRKVVVQ